MWFYLSTFIVIWSQKDISQQNKSKLFAQMDTLSEILSSNLGELVL